MGLSLSRAFKAASTLGASELGGAGDKVGIPGLGKYAKPLNPLGTIFSDKMYGESDKADPNAGLDLYNDALLSNSQKVANNKKNQYYGSTLTGLGGETENYVGRLQGNLDKNVAKADLYNQSQATQRGLQNTKAGLSGVDTSALNEQSRRNASFGAAAINEDAQRQALDVYGTSISNRIEGANKIDNSEMALAIASMKQPQTNYKPGLLGSIFSGFSS